MEVRAGIAERVVDVEAVNQERDTIHGLGGHKKNPSGRNLKGASQTLTSPAGDDALILGLRLNLVKVSDWLRC